MTDIFEVWKGRTLMAWFMLLIAEMNFLLAVLIYYSKSNTILCLFCAFFSGWGFYAWVIDKQQVMALALINKMLKFSFKLINLNGQLMIRFQEAVR